MGHFAKLGGLAGLAALLAATTPADAGFRGAYYHPHARIGHVNGPVGGYGASGYNPLGYAPRWGGPSYGYGYGYGGVMPEAPYVEPQPYPVGYGEPSYEPTGYGVVYNIPPTPRMWRPGPRIIYVNDVVHHRHHHHYCARRHGFAHHVAIVRGGYAAE
jgi:hypothetical protein